MSQLDRYNHFLLGGYDLDGRYHPIGRRNRRNSIAAFFALRAISLPDSYLSVED